jgi:ATP-binding cassette subfamily F protein 1
MNLYNFLYEKFTYNFNSISLEKFSLSINSKNLFDNTDLKLSYGQRYGLIGKNGYGKSSLLKQLKSICNDDKIKILYVEQELENIFLTPLEYVLNSNDKLKLLQNRVIELNYLFENDQSDYNQEIYEKLEEAQIELESYNPDKEESKIKKILNGLGFNQDSINKKINTFSGGWQMRISLARALYLEPDLLLLDEPTNHLDLEAIIWLSDYLQTWKKISIIVSHNIGFLNSVCTYILNIELNKLVLYKGNYNKFKNTYEKKLKEQHKEYEKFEKKIKELKKKDTQKKDIDNYIKNNFVQRPEKDYNVRIEFFETRKYPSNIIKLENVTFSYENNLILDNISFGLDMNSKICLVGLNGSGKSTLIKLISGDIKPNNGNIIIKDGINIGYYNQHFDQQLPFEKTPIEFLSDYDDYQVIRSYLGKIKLESSAHTKKIGELSGGQKARVALVNLIFQKPHMLLLDEPTNHLDIETVETLIDSLETYNNGILLITHEPELINRLETKLWYMDNKTKKINYDIESFDDYCDIILSSQLQEC